MDACCGFRKAIETYGVCIKEYAPFNQALDIQKVILPVFGDEDVLIEVKAASINPCDWKMAEGLLKDKFPVKFPYIIGRDFAGIIKKCGSNVNKLSRGDRVFGYQPLPNQGTFSQFVIVNKNYVAKLDDSIDFEDAASIPFCGGVAYHVIKNIFKIQENNKIWITNGSGGVGNWAVQIAKEFGAIVIATTSTDNKSWVRKLGADEVIDYKLAKPEQYPKNVNFIFDTRGISNDFDFSKHLAPGGMVISIAENLDATNPKIQNINFKYYEMQAHCDYLPILIDLINKDRIKQQIRKKYKFPELIHALDMIKMGHVDGKDVIAIDEKEILKAYEAKDKFFVLDKPKMKHMMDNPEKSEGTEIKIPGQKRQYQ